MLKKVKKTLEELLKEALWLRGGLRELDVCTSRTFKSIDSYSDLADYCKNHISVLKDHIKELIKIRNEAQQGKDE